jgi:soluble lytic murein transglycosylase
MGNQMKDVIITVARVWLAALLIALPLTASAAGLSPQDRAVLAAVEAFRAGDKTGLARQAEKARGHVLDVYVRFWSLSLRLEEAAPDELRDFLAGNRDTVLAEQLRRDWLRVLGKNGQWERFREEYPAIAQGDSEIACYALQAQWRLQNESASTGIKPFWNAPKALPQGCVPLAEAMLQSGTLTPRDLRDRFRLLVAAHQMPEAMRILGRLPAGQMPSPVQIGDVVKAPAVFLERSDTDWNSAAGRELALCALIRQAQSDTRLAARYWSALPQDRFPREDRQYVWALLAAQGALRHLPEAVDWFREAGEMPLSEEQLLWRARIALRQENWPEVKSAIERLSPATQAEPVWTFWLGRSLIALGVQEEGRKLLGGIAGGYDFYGRLAAEELGMPLQIPPQEAPPSGKEVEEVAVLPGLKRALALYRLGLRSEATREWVWTVRTMDDRALLAAALLAHRNGIWDRAINTADRTVVTHDFSRRYPQHYSDVLSREARLRQLDESLVFGLVRQESRFIVDAQSPAGATGLMQLLPSTARWVARKIGLKRFQPSRTNKPEVNAALGAFYLRQMLDGFDGSPVLAAAAYNAGPNRARKWCGTKPLEGAIYIETIPFAETRQYVKKVMVNALYYAALSGGERRSLKSSLGVIKGMMPLKDAAVQ